MTKIRPKAVFVPHEKLATGLVVRADDLPWFEDIDEVRTYLFIDLKGSPNRQLAWTESEDPRDIDEFMSRQSLVMH